MLGVLANAVGIALGSVLGVLFKNFVSPRVQEKMEIALGFCSFAIGIKMALKFDNVFVMIGCVVLGGVVGTLCDLEGKVEKFGEFIQKRAGRLAKGEFVKGFTVASILFCTGAMAVVGAINSGVMGDHEILFAKTTLDGLISISFASIYGIGVAFSAISVFLYQGAIALGASQLEVLTAPLAIADISGVGGVLVMMIGLNVARITKIAVGDYLPAMIFVIAFHALVPLFS